MLKKKKDKILAWLLTLAMLFSLTGCGSGGTQSIIKDGLDDVFEVVVNEDGQASQPVSDAAPSEEPDAPGGTLTVTFLDIGQGDAALLECDGEYMLIDGGEKDQSNVIYSVLKARGIETLDVMVATHGHSDHVGGLSGALNYASVGTAYCSVTEYDSAAFNNMVRFLSDQGVELTVPKAGDTFYLGSALVTILGPVREYEEPNDTSIVLRVDYGETSFLFTGDMETSAENDLVASGADLDVDVLKVGHHGSYTSTGYQFLRSVLPDYAVISCATGNSYGHPHDETMSKLRDAEVTVYRTDLQGDITCVSDGKALSWTTDKTADQAELNSTLGDGSGQVGTGSETEASTAGYIGNINSGVYHLPTCNSLPKESNRILFDTVEEAQNAGYRACGACGG